jgi:hypothetical protein
MSIPASITFYKDGRKVGTVPCNASYGSDWRQHIKSMIPYIKEEWFLDRHPEYRDIDAVQSSLDPRNIMYLSGEVLLANEVIRDDEIDHSE